MRYITALVGYFVLIFSVFGIAGAGISNLNEMTARQNRELDAEINRMVAEHNERKLLALAPDGQRGHGAKARMAAQETNGTATSDSAEAPRQVATRNTTKNLGRHGRNHDHFIPLAFASLPKFTAYTLFGPRRRSN
jgi:hypothetical protein